MKSTTLLKVLDEQDRENGIWLLTPAMLRVLFPDESESSLKMSLRRHVKSGLIKQVKKGLYANERALSVPADKLPALVAYLKPGEINYLSQESRLSQLGVISQLPLNHLTLMTSGTSQVFHTCYGTVEFTHTKRAINFVLDHTELDPETGLLAADKLLALKDLNRAGRNQDLVDEQAMKDAQ